MESGRRVRVAMTKWGDRPHWEFEATYLGRDDQGDWLGVPAGTPFDRPGAHLVMENDQVVLAPTPPRWPPTSGAPELDPEVGWVATFHAPGGFCEVYVDITTPPWWDGDTLRAVDLDLDVIRMPHGRSWVDDEDEFADHRVRFAYPPDLVSHAAVSCDFVHTGVRDRLPPYDPVTPAVWLERTAALRP